MFIGREHELLLLRKLWEKGHSSFVVCKGRRRIGKSTLIQEFGKQADVFLEFQGAFPEKKMNNRDQMRIFVEQLRAQTETPRFQPENWQQIFSFLAMSIPKDQRCVVFLDEISWMAEREPSFTSQLKIAWDTQFKKYPQLILVVCGSISSWIDENILNHTGFMGRVSLELIPTELPLYQCNQFWKNKTDRVSSMEKLRVLAVTGGIPRYLEEINPSFSAEENLKRLCFTKEGILFREFGRIFHDIFDRRAKAYKEIVQALVYGSKTITEIATVLKIPKNGHMTKHLENLVASGFLARDQSYSVKTGKPTRTVKFRLKDNYLRFYLKYIEPHHDKIESGLFDSVHLENFSQWDIIMGLQFENLVLNHLSTILDFLSINKNAILSASPYFQKKTSTQEACQIDLLLQSKYSVYLCEIKFRKKIDTTVIDEMLQKMSRLAIPKMTSIRPVLIYEGELSSKVLEEDFFDRVIPFSNLLKYSS